MSSELCRAIARDVLDQMDIHDPPVDVAAIAEAHGLRVRYVTRGAGFEGRLIAERLAIEVNRRHHRHKQRFTIAHEIGHFVLGHSPVVSVFDNRSIADPGRVNERQANAFGSDLLMPEAWIRDHWSRLRDIGQMAEAFDVSPEAMYYQLETLDLLGLPPAR